MNGINISIRKQIVRTAVRIDETLDALEISFSVMASLGT